MEVQLPAGQKAFVRQAIESGQLRHEEGAVMEAFPSGRGELAESVKQRARLVCRRAEFIPLNGTQPRTAGGFRS